MRKPPLKFLHSEEHLIRLKLEQFRKLSDKVLIDSLRPGEKQPLVTKQDGTVLEGHHRLKILQERGVDIDSLPRETIDKDAPTT
jgi:hypothetical protein